MTDQQQPRRLVGAARRAARAAADNAALSPAPQPVCDRCKQPAHRVTGATENGQPVEIWHHDEVADDVFCGMVMHAADRLPR